MMDFVNTKPSAMSHPYVEATDANFTEEVENFAGTVLVDFWATWCGPCLMLAPVIEKIAHDYADKEDVKIVKLDVDQYPELAMKHNVTALPTLKFFKNGQLVGESRAYQPENEIVNQLEAARAAKS